MAHESIRQGAPACPGKAARPDFWPFVRGLVGHKGGFFLGDSLLVHLKGKATGHQPFVGSRFDSYLFGVDIVDAQSCIRWKHEMLTRIHKPGGFIGRTVRWPTGGWGRGVHHRFVTSEDAPTGL